MNPFSIPLYAFSVVYLLKKFFEDRKNCLKIFTILIFSYAISENLKLIFGIKRHHFFSPFRYPSSHATVATTFFFLIGKELIPIYAIVYILALYGRIYVKAHDILDLIGGILTGIFSFLVFRKLEKKIGREWYRKSFHIFLGTILYLISLHFFDLLRLCLLTLVIVGLPLVFISEKRKIPLIEDFLEFYGTGKYRGLCAFTFILGCLVASVFGKEAFIFGVLNLTWVDTGSFLFVKLFKTKRRSLHSLLGAYLFLTIPILEIKKFNPFFLLAPLSEFFSFHDNISLPFLASLIYFLFENRKN